MSSLLRSRPIPFSARPARQRSDVDGPTSFGGSLRSTPCFVTVAEASSGSWPSSPSLASSGESSSTFASANTPEPHFRDTQRPYPPERASKKARLIDALGVSRSCPFDLPRPHQSSLGFARPLPHAILLSKRRHEGENSAQAFQAGALKTPIASPLGGCRASRLSRFHPRRRSRRLIVVFESQRLSIPIRAVMPFFQPGGASERPG